MATVQNHYIVFAGRKWQNAMGRKGITWDVAGVWRADDEEHACLIAAQQHGVGTCFAIRGFAWGVDTVEAGRATELGVELDPIQRLERMGERLGESLTRILPSVSRPELDRGEDAER